MTLRTRRMLMWALIALFFVAGTVIVLYAQGWRLSPKDLSISKVGALYVETSPEQTTIILDGKILNKRRSVFNDGVFIQNVFPGTHTLQVQAPNYHSVDATISVSPALITRLPNVILVPKRSQVIVPENVETFWKNEQMLLVKNKRGELLQDGSPVPGGSVVAQSPEHIITESISRNNYFVVKEDGAENLTQQLARTLTLHPSNSRILDVNGQTLLATTPLGVYLVQLDDYSFTKLDSRTAQLATHDSPWVVWTSPEDPNTATIYNAFSQEIIRAHTFESSIQKLAIANNELIVLEENGGLSTLSLGGESFSPIAGTAIDFTLSPKQSRLAVIEKSAIEVFELPDTKEETSLRFAIQDKPSATWHGDEEHLFLHYPNRVSLLSLADTHLEYIMPVADTTRGVHDIEDGAFYYLQNSALRMKKLP